MYVSISQGMISIKIKDNLENITKLLENNHYIMYNSCYTLDIYMINKESNKGISLRNVKDIDSFQNYAIINDTNGVRKVTLYQEKEVEAKVYSIFLIKDLLYQLGYVELMHINQEQYQYQIEKREDAFDFVINEVRGQGVFLQFFDTRKNLQLIHDLEQIGMVFEHTKHPVNFITTQIEKVKNINKGKYR